MFLIAHLLAQLFRFGITSVKGTPDPIPGTEQAGALIPNAALVQQLSAFQNNAAPAFGNFSQTVIPNVSAFTYNANSMVGGIIRRFSTGGTNITDSTDTATNIVNAIPGAKVNQTFPMILANLNSTAGITLAGGTGVTMAGTNIVGGASARLFLGQVLGSAAVTLTGCFSWALTSTL